MPTSDGYEYHDFHPALRSFLDEVTEGLSAPRKALAPKYFYDERGARLFEAICELPEYYLTRTETAILESCGSDIAERVGPRAAVLEYGSGSGRKTALFLHAARPAAYVAIDISGEQLRDTVSRLARDFQSVRMAAVCADYTRALPLSKVEALAGARRVVFFPGSTIGNFTTDEARTFLMHARDVAGPGGAMLVGVDLKKDATKLHAAYNDAAGVTAAFNLNVLERINRELRADFDLSAFEHRAHYDEALGRIEMHLVSTRVQRVHVDGRAFEFRAGETIHTESSYKYTVAEFQALAKAAGFEPAHCWCDAQRLFSIHYLEAAA